MKFTVKIIQEYDKQVAKEGKVKQASVCIETWSDQIN